MIYSLRRTQHRCPRCGSGEITSQNTTEGRRSETAFYFHVVVTDLSTGLAVWEDTFDLAKQSKESFLGM